jgi:hypothetical protein
VLTGGLIAIFAFVLAMGWDIWKTWRDRRRRDRAVLQASLAEVEAIRATVQNNQNLVEHEPETLPQHLINPLDPFESGFWELVRLDPPAMLLKRLPHSHRSGTLREGRIKLGRDDPEPGVVSREQPSAGLVHPSATEVRRVAQAVSG